MEDQQTRPLWHRIAATLLSEYGMILVLLVLCVGISIITITDVEPNGASAGKSFAEDFVKAYGADIRVLVVSGERVEDVPFVTAATEELTRQGVTVVAAINGEAVDVRRELVRLNAAGEQLDFIVGNSYSANWPLFDDLAADFPQLGDVQIVKPRGYKWSSFLKKENLLNVVNNTTVFAMIGIGMTMVIITGGIDLSVGSLVALSAVLSTILIRDIAGAKEASDLSLVWCCGAAIGVCALLGALSGTIVLKFHTRPYIVPPFIMTLSMMLVAPWGWLSSSERTNRLLTCRNRFPGWASARLQASRSPFSSCSSCTLPRM